MTTENTDERELEDVVKPGEEREPEVDATAAPASLAKRLAEAMLEVERVDKDGRNEEHNYNYASIEAILAGVRRPLLERGIILIPNVTGVDEKTVRSRGGTEGTALTLTVDFTFVDGETGDTFTVANWRGQGIDYQDKAYGKAYTSALKTFIRSTWLLPTGDDPEAESPERMAASSQAAPAAPPRWAQQASDERLREFIGALGELGVPNDAAAKIIGAGRERWGGTFPNVAVAIGKAIAGAHPDVAATREAAAAQAAAEAPDTPPADDTAGQDPPPDDEPAAEAEAEPENRLAPASVDAPDLEGANLDDVNDRDQVERLYRGLGCTCDDPLAVDDVAIGKRDKVELKPDGEPPLVDDACPIKTHGIPF